MEFVGAMCEGELAGFGGMFFTEETNFMAEFLGNYPFPSEQNGDFLPSHHEPVSGFDESVFYNSHDYDYTNSCYHPSECSNDSYDTVLHPATVEGHYYLNGFGPVSCNNFNPIEFCMGEEQNPNKAFSGNLMEEVQFMADEMSGDSFGGSSPNVVPFPDQRLQPKRKYEMSPIETVSEIENNPQKKRRASGSVRWNKKLKNQGTNASYADMNGQSSSSSNSEDTTARLELSGGETSNSKPVDLKGKTRAGRGSATDPQSIYARKRRERINERLRILQTLIPNGTKVDISTMLEEAVQYVKFLQVQIKLLSSNELWKYAPLAYNGMDLGLTQDLKR